MTKQQKQEIIRGLKLCILGGTCKICPYYKRKLLKQVQECDYKEVEHFDCEWELYQDTLKLIREGEVKQLTMFSQLNSEEDAEN